MRRGERPSAGLILLDGLYVLIGAGLAVAAAWPIYQHPQLLLVGAVGTAVGLLCALGGRALRLPLWADLVAAIALYLVVAVPVAIPSAFPGHWFTGLRDAAVGVVTGWKDIVTVEPPLGTYQAVLIPFLVVVLFGSYAAARVSGSDRARVAAPLVLLAMFGFGVAFGVSELGAQYAPGRVPVLPVIGVLTVGQVFVAAAIALVVVSLVWLAVRSRRTRAEALARASGVSQSGVAVRAANGWAVVRRGALATAMVAIAVVGAGFVAVPAAQAQRDVIRDQVRPLELATRQTSPLSAYRGWLSAASYDTELFTLEAPDDVDRVRLVVMDAYDGTRFLVSQRPDGSRFTRIQGTAASGGAPIAVTFGAGYGEPWVPLPGDRTSPVAFPAGGDRALVLQDSLYYSTDDSLAIVVAPGADGRVGFAPGDRIAVSGAVATDARDRIASVAGAAPLGGVDWDLLPQLTGWIEAQHAGSGGPAVLTLVDRLRERGYLSHGLLLEDAEGAEWYAELQARSGEYVFKESRAGHSVQRLEALFRQLSERAAQADAGSADPAAYVAAVGDDEQFAAAAALIAWAHGVPARVVLGVRLDDAPQDGSPRLAAAVPACEPEAGGAYLCTGRNVSAWVEIGVGGDWVPLDASPQFEVLPADAERGASPPEFGTIPERPASTVIDPPDAVKNRIESEAAEDDAAGPILSQSAMQAIRIAALVAGAIALLLVPPGILVGGKALRRSRRRGGDPEASIVGAWEELVDGCVDLRLVPAAAGGTRAQLANRIDDPVARQLAAVADRAVFGPTAPTDADRALAWRLMEEEGKRLRRDVPFWQRVRGRLSPASFLRHLRPTSARRTLEPDQEAPE